MSYLSRIIISKFTLLAVVFILLPGIFYYFYLNQIKSSLPKEKTFHRELPDFLAQLNRRWKYGDLENLWGTDKFKCSDIPSRTISSNSNLLRCNGTYLKCIFSNGVDGIDSFIKTKHHKFSAKKNSFKKIAKGDLKVDFIEQVTKTEFSIRLEHFCHSTFLPEKIYSSGPDPLSVNIWDNYNRNIFIDKYYAGEASLKLGPILNYSLQEQKDYCFKQGKTLLQSHIFDAATFFPSNYEEGFLFKSKYPWSKNSRISPKRKKDKKVFDNAISWIGIERILGHELESFHNVFNHKANLKVSNNQLKENSFWNQLGTRGFWNGENLSLNSFVFNDFYTNTLEKIVTKPKGVAFRCMSIK